MESTVGTAMERLISSQLVEILPKRTACWKFRMASPAHMPHMAPIEHPPRQSKHGCRAGTDGGRQTQQEAGAEKEKQVNGLRAAAAMVGHFMQHPERAEADHCQEQVQISISDPRVVKGWRASGGR